MNKKLIALILMLSLLFTMSACITENEEATTNEATTSEETTVEATTEEETTAVTQTVNIMFNEAKAKQLYTFDSEIYGKLTIFLQDGYFLIFDEFGGKRFTVYAENYSSSKTGGEPVGISADMNFDGYTDFGVCYYKDELNSYYFCYLWDNDTRTFNYYMPLSDIANPSFNKVNETVISDNRITYLNTNRKTFYFLGDELRHLSEKQIEEEPSQTTVIGAEHIDAKPEIMENGNSALISLNTNPFSSSSWKCIIDNEKTVFLSSENYNEAENKYEFLLTAASAGETFVSFRYVSSETDTYVDEIVLRVLVDENMNVKAEEL